MAEILLNNELREAIEASDLERVRLALDKGVDPNWASTEHSIHPNSGRALTTAIAHASPDVVKELIRFGADVNRKDDSLFVLWPLSQAIKQHVDPDIVKALIEAGANINNRSVNGQTSMMYLMAESSLPFSHVLPLISKIEDFDERHTLTGETFLHLVRAREDDENKLNVLKAFIEAGVPIHRTDYEGDTPLHNLASICALDCIRYLIESGANIQARNKNGETCLHILAENSEFSTFSDCLKYLLEQGANIKALDNYGKTVLHHAVCGKNATVEAIKEILNTGIPLNVRDVFGHNEIYNIVSYVSDYLSNEESNKCIEMIKLLKDAGVNLNASGVDGMTALHLAANKHNTTLLLALLELGGNVFAPTDSGVNPLHLATLRFDTGPLLIDWHAKHGHSLDLQDMYGSTPLHYAVWFREQINVKCLLQNGADANIADKSGRTPKEMAKLVHYDDYIQSADKFQDLPAVVLGTDITQDFHGTDPFEECPFSEYIEYEPFQDIRLEEWKDHIKHHENAIQQYADCVLLSMNMGLFYDVNENDMVPAGIDKLMHQLSAALARRNSLFSCELRLAGSMFEGTKIGATDEFDYIWCLSEFSKHFNPVESKSFPKGFVKMQIAEGSEMTSRFAEFVDSDGYLNGREVIYQMYTILNEEVIKIFNEGTFPEGFMLGNVLDCTGGSLSSLSIYYVGQHAKFFDISIDVVPTFMPQGWKPQDFSRENAMILQNVAQRVSFSIVMKSPDANFVQEPTAYFRKSNASLEQSAIRNAPGNIRKGYILVKALAGSTYFPRLVHSETMDTTNLVTSYRLKMCFLHQLENALRNDESSLRVTDPTECREVSIAWARRIVMKFEDFLKAVSLPSFFEPDKNLLMFEGASEVFNQHMYIAQVTCLRELLDIVERRGTLSPKTSSCGTDKSIVFKTLVQK